MRFSCVNGESTQSCPVSDRGLQFGDGLFETMLCVAGTPVNFDRHWKRLSDGCDRLRIRCPNVREQVLDAIDRHGRPRAVAKLVVTRGSSERGYRCAPTVQPNWALTIGDAPDVPATLYEQGGKVRICNTRLPLEDPQLAGLKHLNRLSQVLARLEWGDECQDGLMRDHAGRLVEGCSSNLFLVSDGILRTPDLGTGGVLGIVRQRVLEHAERERIPHAVTPLDARELERAAEVFLTNSVFGILPVREVEGRRHEIGPVTRRLLEELCRGVYFE